ncbi:MAG: T9SS type A sorting domain-containing protein [Bacteroidales bacterium]|nr:T9SS type A sorting domain-containing protein [Bacteroidales bacterium]
MKNLKTKMLNFIRDMQYMLYAVMLVSATVLQAQEVVYQDSWGNEGYTLEQQSADGVKVNFSITRFTMRDDQINGESMRVIDLPGHFLPNDEGAPNLPGSGRFIAIPQGAEAVVEVISARTDKFQDVDLAPAFRIPWDTEPGPLQYEKDMTIYGQDAFYPAQPVQLSELTEIRGVDAVMLGITPFQYNPVTRELIVYRDLEIRVTFEGGNGQFGDNRLRSRWWDPLFSDMFLNFETLPEMDYNRSFQGDTRDTGCEYLIVVPTGAEFQQWADSIRIFRNRQGIQTDVVTVDDCGGNTATALEAYFNNAYNNWDIVPAAVLLMADYGTNPAMNIIAPIYNNYCASDNIYADVTGNSMPDIVFARMTANSASQLQVMVTKFLNYERTPPTNPDFYQHPITALGWQTERWFQICSETVGGYWKHELGKEPVRINAIFSGNPTTIWSTAQNTSTVVNFFGPNGLGYIPATPAELGGWSGGNATMVNNAINSGSFMLQHRDHGWEQGWGEPAYSSTNINALTNTDLTFVLSINCLTGKYNMGGECFTEKFHRHTASGNNSGALGLTAASEVSYSFVNDTYVWGLYDNMWPDFMPTYGTTPDSRDIRPAFGNAAGKYFLQSSNWPYNTSNKMVTYNLFHHHGDAFNWVYSEVPQNLTVSHESSLAPGATTFEVTADDGSFIALSVNDEIIGTGDGTGAPVSIEIPSQTPPGQMRVVVTKQNYYRYEALVDIQYSTTAFAGDDAVICEGSDYQCMGTATNYNSVEWSTSGTGTFDNTAILEPLYTPSTDDILNGSVTLTLTAIGASVTVNDDMDLTIIAAATGDAGSDGLICETDVFQITEAAADNYSSIMWSTSGDGTFDDATLMNPVYTPGTQDLFNGSAILTMMVYGNQPCGDVQDDLVLTIEKQAEAFAGADATICETDGYQLMDATAGNYSSLAWTTAGDGTFDDATILNPTYTPGAGDISAGSVTLTITAIGNQPCGDVDAQMVLSIVATATVDAGADGEICHDATFPASGTVSGNYDTYMWSTSGDGTFDDPSLMNPIYTPGQQDIQSGTVNLTLSATAFAPCTDITDELTLTVKDCSGWGEITSADGFGIYPNPTNGAFTIRLNVESNQVSMTLFNSLGEKVYENREMNVAGETSIPLDLDLENGIYYLRIEGDDFVSMQKLIVR